LQPVAAYVDPSATTRIPLIATRQLPPAYVRWNDRWGAPFGHQQLSRRLVARFAPSSVRPAVLGPFSVQLNNEPRVYEYPWAYHAVPVQPGTLVVDVGAGLSGFQFVLARAGARAIAVDPVLGGEGHWGVDVIRHRRLNRIFRTDVALMPCRLEDAAISVGTVQTIYCLSTLEHLSKPDAMSLIRYAADLLVPGGHLVLTVDLFLNVAPFSDRAVNTWGSNHDVAGLVDGSGLALVQGERAELNGFEEFDPRRVLANLERYLVGSYPAVAQALVLQK